MISYKYPAGVQKKKGIGGAKKLTTWYEEVKKEVEENLPSNLEQEMVMVIEYSLYHSMQ